MEDVGVVIVTYNSAGEIGPCLDALTSARADVVVVDNASQDGTRDEVGRRGVRLIANDSNRGFARAVNQGIRVLDRKYILLLNPDAILLTAIEPLRQACKDANVAAASGKLVN